ncbi:MAG: DUF2314 domain-containing protein [Verrucomicrobium sp.]
MKNAYRLASETLPNFMAHLAIGDERFCSLKLCFRDPDLSERLGEDRLFYWWLDFAKYDAEQKLFSAEFTEVPTGLEKYHQIGQRLLIEGEDIFDWRVNQAGRLYGGFTIRVARVRIPESERAAYDQYIGVTEYLKETAP